MPKTNLMGVVLLFIVACSGGEQSVNEMTVNNADHLTNPATAADTIYTNGKIYTVNEEQPWVEAVAIKDGEFFVIGSSADIEAVAGEGTEIVDLGGQFVMPGLIDSHLHPHFPFIQAEAGNLQFASDLDADGIAAAIRTFAAANPDKKWIRGGMYGFGAFPGAKMTREWLDQVIPDRPALMEDESGHNFTANSLALEMAGITAETPDPPLGTIDRDPDTGRPTGYLSEAGISLVGQHLERIPVEAFHRAIRRALEKMTAWGVTAFIDMATTAPSVAVYKQMETSGELPFHVNAALMLNEYSGEYWTSEQALAHLPEARELSSEQVRTDQFKYWADGTPLSYTSLTIDPYSNLDTHGMLTMTEEMRKSAIELLGQGYSGHTHAIGDGSVRWVLDLVESAHEQYPGKVRRFHMGHNHLIHPDDLERYVHLDIVAEISPPQWFPFAATPLVHEFLGEERYQRWLDVRAMLDAGITVAYGSDWPTGSPTGNPFRGLESLVTRAHPSGEYEGIWGEPISVAEMISSATMGGAYAMGREDSIGSIEVGKHADMIIIDQNLFEIEPSDISETRVLATIFNGEVVFRSVD